MNLYQFKTAHPFTLPDGIAFTPTNPCPEGPSDLGELVSAEQVRPLQKANTGVINNHSVRSVFGFGIHDMQRAVLSQFIKGRTVEIGAGAYGGISSRFRLPKDMIVETDASSEIVKAAQAMGKPVHLVEAAQLDQNYGSDALDVVIGILVLDSMDMDQRYKALESIYKALKPGGHLIHFVDDGANNHVFDEYCKSQGYVYFPSEYDRLTRILIPQTQIAGIVDHAEATTQKLLKSYLSNESLGPDENYFSNVNRIAAYLTQQQGALRVSPNDVFYLDTWWSLQTLGYELVHFGLLQKEWLGPADLRLDLLRKSKDSPMPNCFINVAGDTYADFETDVPRGAIKRRSKMHVMVARKPIE